MACSRCENPLCEPERIPRSKTPCATCRQPYGDHCWERHNATQFAVFSGEDKARLLMENSLRSEPTTPENEASQHREMLFVAMQCTGEPRPPEKMS